MALVKVLYDLIQHTLFPFCSLKNLKNSRERPHEMQNLARWLMCCLYFYVIRHCIFVHVGLSVFGSHVTAKRDWRHFGWLQVGRNKHEQKRGQMTTINNMDPYNLRENSLKADPSFEIRKTWKPTDTLPMARCSICFHFDWKTVQTQPSQQR